MIFRLYDTRRETRIQDLPPLALLVRLFSSVKTHKHAVSAYIFILLHANCALRCMSSVWRVYHRRWVFLLLYYSRHHTTTIVYSNTQPASTVLLPQCSPCARCVRQCAAAQQTMLRACGLRFYERSQHAYVCSFVFACRVSLSVSLTVYVVLWYVSKLRRSRLT